MNPSGQWATGPPNMPGVPARPVQQQQQPRVPQQGPPPPGMAHGPPMHMQHHGMPRPMHAPMQLPLPGQMPMTAPLTLPPPMPAQPVPGLLLPGPNEPLFLPPGTATLAEDLDSTRRAPSFPSGLHLIASAHRRPRAQRNFSLCCVMGASLLASSVRTISLVRLVADGWRARATDGSCGQPMSSCKTPSSGYTSGTSMAMSRAGYTLSAATILF